MRAKVNKGCAMFYAGVFCLMTLTGVLASLRGGFEAFLVAVSSETTIARPGSYDAGENPWLEYSYEVDGRIYENTHRIGHAELARCLELDAVKVEYSRQLPGFSRFEKPSALGLLGIVFGYSILSVVLVILGLGGAVGMYGMAASPGETETDES